MSFELEGTLHKKFETENKTDTFQAREFVVKTDGTYPQLVKFQLTQDKCGALDPFNEEELVKVFFDLRGREWNGKYFTNLNAWKIEKVSQNVPQGGAMPTEEPPFNNFSEDNNIMSEDMKDLPF